MKIAFYCQHVLGVGHFHRSLELCKELVKEHKVTLILGGPDIQFQAGQIQLFKLPGLEMDQDFKNLQPCKPGNTLDEVKEQRKEALLELFQKEKFDIFITELYPFGRKAFRFELDPLLQAIKDGGIAPCKVYCSLRDILVERKSDTEKFESRVVRKLHRYFHGILVHSDHHYIPLGATFSQLDNVSLPIAYTGFVTRKIEDQSPELSFPPNLKNKKLVVASIGGGNVGEELLMAAALAFSHLLQYRDDIYLQIFTGLYSPESLFIRLQAFENKHITVSSFSNYFKNWLEKADLSISMAGYNSCLDTITARSPALLYPFKQNHEQELRVQQLKQAAPLHLLTEEQLHPEKLANLIETSLDSPAYFADIAINGSRETVKQLNEWSGKHGT